MVPRPAKATPPPANRSQNDRTASAPLPLSPREQQVCDYLSQGSTFEAIARDLSCSPAAARAYHRRALDKHQRTIALASHEQNDGSTPSDRLALAKPEPAIAEQSHRRLAIALPSRCEQKPFHRPAVEAPALLEHTNPLDLCVSSLFVTGIPVATGGVSFSQTTITDPPRHPRRRKCSSRRNRWAGVGFCAAAAS
jgi:DNA-binding CsgD family transcriptional regulator